MSMTPLIQRIFPGFPYPHAESCRILQRGFRRLRYHIEGADNIPTEGPVLLIMNHTGWEEVLLTILSARRPIKFVGIHEELYLDEELSWERLFETVHFDNMGPRGRALCKLLGRQLGDAIRQQLLAFGFIPTHVRSHIRGLHVGTNGFREVMRCLAEGEMIVLFPEGGIHRQGEMLPFRPGLGLILRRAERMGIPLRVLPAGQHCAGAVSWTLGTAFEPRLVYGQPLQLSGAGQAAAEFDRFVTRHLQEQVHALMVRAWAPAAPPPQSYHQTHWNTVDWEAGPEQDRLRRQGRQSGRTSVGDL